MRNFLRNFVRSKHGTAAIEFAIIVPVLTVIVVTLSDVATIATGMGEMQTAARAAAQYAINGGTDTSVAKTQGLNAWDNEPADGDMSVVVSCTCAGTANDCQTTCADGTYPNEYVTVTTTGTLSGHMISKAETMTEVVRVR